MHGSAKQPAAGRGYVPPSFRRPVEDAHQPIIDPVLEAKNDLCDLKALGWSKKRTAVQASI